jgi:hypothetical protein
MSQVEELFIAFVIIKWNYRNPISQLKAEWVAGIVDDYNILRIILELFTSISLFPITLRSLMKRLSSI